MPWYEMPTDDSEDFRESLRLLLRKPRHGEFDEEPVTLEAAAQKAAIGFARVAGISFNIRGLGHTAD